MKTFLLFSLLFITAACVRAQDCNGLFLFNQEAVDEVPIDHPDCTSFEFIFIQELEPSSITNLNGLSNITSVGTLNINNNEALENLSGLENLETVEDLSIDFNPALENIDALSGLNTLGELRILQNPLLSSIQGLENVTSLNSIHLSDLPMLETLDGLSSVSGHLEHDVEITNLSLLESLLALSGIESINSNLVLYNLPNLGSLTGLHNLDSVRSSIILGELNQLQDLTGLSNLVKNSRLQILDNQNLQNLSGLESLQELELSLDIVNCPQLENLDALSNLDFIGANIQIASNAILSSLQGLEQVNTDEMESLYISECPLLSECAVASICNYLEDPDRFHEVFDNDENCSSREEILVGCSTLSIENPSPKGAFRAVYPNPFVNILHIESVKDGMLEVLDVSGRSLQQVRIYRGTENIDLSDLSSGLYILAHEDGSNFRVVKR